MFRYKQSYKLPIPAEIMHNLQRWSVGGQSIKKATKVKDPSTFKQKKNKTLDFFYATHRVGTIVRETTQIAKKYWS